MACLRRTDTVDSYQEQTTGGILKTLDWQEYTGPGSFVANHNGFRIIAFSSGFWAILIHGELAAANYDSGTLDSAFRDSTNAFLDMIEVDRFGR